MAILNMVEALDAALQKEMKKDNRVVVLGEDVGKDGGVFRVTKGIQKRFGTNRSIDTPLSESGIIGTSIGMALYGLRPVAEIQFSGFVYPGFNQIVSHAARIRNRTRGRYSVQLVIRMPYGGGIRALEHHSESMEALFVHTPGIKVVIPSNPYDAKGLLISSIRDPDPVIFMEPKRVYRSIKQEVPDKDYTIPLGKGNIVQEGNDITIISWGAMLQESIKAVEVLNNENISVELIDLRTLSPMDTDLIIKSFKKTGRAVIVEEGPRTCGVGAEIVAQITEKAVLSMKGPIERLSGFDTIFPLYKNEKLYLPNKEKIIKSVKKVIENNF